MGFVVPSTYVETVTLSIHAKTKSTSPVSQMSLAVTIKKIGAYIHIRSSSKYRSRYKKKTYDE